jgi:1-deoxy-D-xylulose-5-phosphate synthase
MPNLVAMAPRDAIELEMMMDFAVSENAPIAIRFPRGEAVIAPENIINRQAIKKGKAEIIKKGKDVAILAVGTMTQTALEASQILEKKGINAQVVNMRFIKPIDTELLDDIMKKFRIVVTLEEGVLTGGFGREVMAYCSIEEKVRVHNIGLPDKFIEHGTVYDLKEKYGLTPEKISETIIDILR